MDSKTSRGILKIEPWYYEDYGAAKLEMLSEKEIETAIQELKE